MRTCLPLEHHKYIAKNTRPSLRWDGVEPIEELRARSEEKLRELLGMNELLPCEPIFEITEEREHRGNRLLHFTLQTEEGYFTHCDLLLPKEQSRPLPLCVCLQGHSTGSHISLGIVKYEGDEKSISGGDRDFAIRAVDEGFAALCIEQRGFGECGGTVCERHAVTALMLGRTLIGERVWDVMRVLDAVEAHFADTVTLKGSVLMGNSGGGTATYYTACLEHRFDGYMPSCAVCTYYDSIIDLRHCICNYVPGIAKYFDMGDLSVMIAPKKFVLVCGQDDNIFPLDGVKETFEIIKKVYRAFGAESSCAMVIGEGGHRFYADDSWKVMKGLLADKN